MKYSINETCYIISGGTPKTTVKEYWNGSIPWLSIKDFISVNRYVSCTERTITELGLKNSAANLLKANDIILSARGTVAEIALLKIPMAFNQSCFGLRTKNASFLNQHYLFYWLNSHKKDIQIGSHGSVFNTITKDDFYRIKIQIPQIEHQQHIVNIISILLPKSF